MDGKYAEPFVDRLRGLGRLAIVTGMCQESLLGAPVPERPTPEIAGGSEGGRVVDEDSGRGGASAKIRGTGKECGQQRTPLWLGQRVAIR
jgi:hypothetical protein